VRQDGTPVPLRSSPADAPGVHEVMPIQRPATIRHRTALFEDATAIVQHEYGSDLSLDDIARSMRTTCSAPAG
jgi:hypothetical protein